jgi:hypothetical protein
MPPKKPPEAPQAPQRQSFRVKAMEKAREVREAAEAQKTADQAATATQAAAAQAAKDEVIVENTTSRMDTPNEEEVEALANQLVDDAAAAAQNNSPAKASLISRSRMASPTSHQPLLAVQNQTSQDTVPGSNVSPEVDSSKSFHFGYNTISNTMLGHKLSPIVEPKESAVVEAPDPNKPQSISSTSVLSSKPLSPFLSNIRVLTLY